MVCKVSVRAVIFDLDGTLMNTADAWRSGVAAMLAGRNDIDHDDALRVWVEMIDAHFPRYLAGSQTYEENRSARLQGWKRVLGFPESSEDDSFWWHLYDEGAKSSWLPFPEVETVLSNLEHLPLAVVTNGDSTLQREKLARLGIEDRFSVTVCSGDLGVAKPAPEIFAHAARRLGCPAESCAFVGDDWDADIEGSSKAGMLPVWINRNRAVPRDSGVVEIPSLDPLPGLLGVRRA